jgi:RNA polymerase sigma-70 factor, ECF subfamily
LMDVDVAGRIPWRDGVCAAKCGINCAAGASCPLIATVNSVPQKLHSDLIALIPRLRRFGIALTGSKADADELVQDACERMLRRSEQLRDMTRLDAWAYSIMRHLWTDHVRSRRIRMHDSMEAAADVSGEDGSAVVENRLALATVRHCLEQLPADQRAILVLVCVDGLSYREAAETLGIALGTVMSRLHRGRLALQEKLAETGRATASNVVSWPDGRSRPL